MWRAKRNGCPFIVWWPGTFCAVVIARAAQRLRESPITFTMTSSAAAAKRDSGESRNDEPLPLGGPSAWLLAFVQQHTTKCMRHSVMAASKQSGRAIVANAKNVVVRPHLGGSALDVRKRVTLLLNMLHSRDYRTHPVHMVLRSQKMGPTLAPWGDKESPWIQGLCDLARSQRFTTDGGGGQSVTRLSVDVEETLEFALGAKLMAVLGQLFPHVRELSLSSPTPVSEVAHLCTRHGCVGVLLHSCRSAAVVHECSSAGALEFPMASRQHPRAIGCCRDAIGKSSAPL